ncbi:glycosyltransferase family 2 protein [Vibrio atypicus]|uniref:glycosyltransferase family 2 protein n=1 Tax=Vibrio atypicus TaxID=558271 RepID=UPI00373582DA
MLKAIAKKALDKRRKNKPIVNIDGVFMTSDMIAINGWLVTNAETNPEDLLQHLDTSVIVHTYARKDVEQAINIQPEQRCYGFVTAFTIVEHTLEHIVIAGQEISLRAQNQAQSLEDIGVYLSEKQQQEVASLTKQTSSKSTSYFFTLDEAFTIGEDKLFIRGWSNDPLNQIKELVVSDGKETSGNLYPNLARFHRDDLAQVPQAKGANLETIGFYACIDIKGYNKSQIKLYLTDFIDKSQTFSNIQAINTSEQISFTKSLLSSCNIHSKQFLSDSREHVLPLLSTLWKRDPINDNEKIINIFGSSNETPSVSVIVPIYGRYDFIAHQIAAFKKDNSFSDFEVIYVLDDPKIEREFNITANGVFQTFKQPFKTIFSGRNLGFSGANNLGVSIAKGKKVLLLNSDILPSQPGWLTRLSTKFDALEDVGILGTKLVYEDGTIQHLGMEFQEDAFHPGIWMNYHPSKGFPEALMGSFGTKEVQAVTGACMLIETEFYKTIGGLDENYILGDFEDSDLCLKTHHHKKKVYLDDEEKLYHLERLSQDLVDAGDWKFKLTLINGTRQISKWNSLIKEVRAQYAE